MKDKIFKYCKVVILDIRQDSLNVEKQERSYTDHQGGKLYNQLVLGVLKVVTQDFNPNDTSIPSINSTSDSFQIRPKLIKLRRGGLYIDNKKVSTEECIEIMSVLSDLNLEEWKRVIKILRKDDSIRLLNRKERL